MTNLQLISKHRSSLMGFAILWVMLYHLCGNGFWAIGHAGVDIFFFLSGFGLTYTYFAKLETRKERFAFYKKRVFRIIPTYYAIIILFAIIYQKEFSVACWQLSCLGFWIGKPYYDWYVPSLLAFYIVFPIFIRLSNKYNIYAAAALFIFIGLVGTIGLIWIGRGTIILFSSRVPVLFVGCIYGHMLKYKSGSMPDKLGG